MNYKHLTSVALLNEAILISKNIRHQVVVLMELLKEINERKLYCDLAYPSLFRYVVEVLKFSEAQAAIYFNVTRELGHSSKIKMMLVSGDLNLSAAHQVSLVIKENKEIYKNDKSILKLSMKFSNLSKSDAKKEGDLLRGKKPLQETHHHIKVKPKILEKMEKLRRKLNLPQNIELESILELLLDEKLTPNSKINDDNKIITAKTKSILLAKANHQCEFQSETGKRCSSTKYLEVDHILPRALGGTHHSSNLRIYCSQHNKKAAMNIFGSHIMMNHSLRKSLPPDK